MHLFTLWIIRQLTLSLAGQHPFKHNHTHSDGYIEVNSRISILPKGTSTHEQEEPEINPLIGRPPALPPSYSYPR